jgi:hypothetical protein
MKTSVLVRAAAILTALSAMVGCVGADEDEGVDTGDSAVSRGADAGVSLAAAEAQLKPYFAPAVLTSRMDNRFAEDQTAKFVGWTSRVQCEVTRATKTELFLERGTELQFDDVAVLSGFGPRRAAIGLKAFLDKRSAYGNRLGSSGLILLCYGRQDNVLPTIEDVVEIFGQNMTGNLRFDLKLSRPLPEPGGA